MMGGCYRKQASVRPSVEIAALLECVQDCERLATSRAPGHAHVRLTAATADDDGWRLDASCSSALHAKQHAPPSHLKLIIRRFLAAACCMSASGTPSSIESTCSVSLTLFIPRSSRRVLRSSSWAPARSTPNASCRGRPGTPQRAVRGHQVCGVQYCWAHTYYCMQSGACSCAQVGSPAPPRQPRRKRRAWERLLLPRPAPWSVFTDLHRQQPVLWVSLR